MTRAAYGPPWAAYGPQNPSPDGIQRHPVSEAVNRAISGTAGQGAFSAGNDKRPQQDSNLRSRLRRPPLQSSEFVPPACVGSIAGP